MFTVYFVFFFFKQKTAYEIMPSLVGSEMCIRDSPLTVTPSRSVTNFFVMYKDNVLPNQRNGVYGHGRERYDAIEEILDANAGSIDREIAWQALQAASQAPNPQDVTSNTQWSILYDNTALTAEAVIRRDWNTKTSYDLVSNVAVTDVG